MNTDIFKFRHYNELDGLRGLAVLMVIVHHWVPRDVFPNVFFAWGKIGVNIFFVLSGFLISSILLKQKNKIEQFSEPVSKHLFIFYTKRVLRIFPLFYLSILLNYFFICKNSMDDNILWHIFYLSNNIIAIKQNFICPSVAVYWSLAVEEQFYMLWPIIIFFVPLRYIKYIIFIFAIGSPLLNIALKDVYPKTGINYNQFLTICHLNGLMMGAGLALLFSYKKMVSSKWLWALLILFNIINFSIPYLGFNTAIRSDLNSFIQEVTVGINTFAIIYTIVVGPKTILNDLLSNTVLVFLGKISYGLYIYHQMIHDLRIVDSSALNLLIKFIILVAICIVSFYGFEKPIMNMKKKFIKADE